MLKWGRCLRSAKKRRHIDTFTLRVTSLMTAGTLRWRVRGDLCRLWRFIGHWADETGFFVDGSYLSYEFAVRHG